ncbi:MAG: hypothetical protein IPJ74_15035 [Saprospiraceae bacterium]|nr:hypothetical protein [Saprospiraceae bacterium]
MNKIRYFLILFFTFWSIISLFSQSDFRQDSTFLREKVEDYRAWLTINQLDELFAIDTLNILSNKVIMTLIPSSNNPVCDTLQATWSLLKREFWLQHQVHFHEHLFEKFLFQFELPADSAELFISCKDDSNFKVRIFFQDGKIELEEYNLKSMGNGSFSILIDSLQNFNAGGRLQKLERSNFETITQQIQRFFEEYYQNRGFWLRKALLITKQSFYNELNLEISHLKNEVVQDGYFEYHNIKVNILQEGPEVKVNWKFQGKYGSGIFSPPRQPKDYKDMELTYREELEEYEYYLFRRLEDHLHK